jgi:hypothetical protein
VTNSRALSSFRGKREENRLEIQVVELNDGGALCLEHTPDNSKIIYRPLAGNGVCLEEVRPCCAYRKGEFKIWPRTGSEDARIPSKIVIQEKRRAKEKRRNSAS